MSRRAIDWPAAAARLAAAIPTSRLRPEVLAWARSRPPREGWAAAFSGGADSLCLLLLLWAHWPERRSRLRALHFNHRLRGAASAADARFCGRVCRALGIGFSAGSWSGARPEASAAAARSARFAFIDREMRRRRLRALWLGHQQDDVAETQLMRLARGSGTAGLAAPRPVQDGPSGRRHLRPLLDLKKREIAGALEAAGIPWREDASNAGPGHFRNRVRRSVLPAWIRASARDALAGAALSRELLEEDDRALEAWTDALGAATPAGDLSLARLSGKPRAVVRRALHRWLMAQADAGDLSRAGFEVLLGAVERGIPVRQSLGAQGFAVIRGRRLKFEKAPAD
jgi:tRNA(Ile)-lysidine synthase